MVVFCYVYSIMLCLFYDTVFYVIVCITRHQESQKRLDRLAGVVRTGRHCLPLKNGSWGSLGLVLWKVIVVMVFYFALQPPQKLSNTVP